MTEAMHESAPTSYGQILRSSSIIGGTNAINYLVGRKVGILICDDCLGRKSQVKTLATL